MRADGLYETAAPNGTVTSANGKIYPFKEHTSNTAMHNETQQFIPFNVSKYFFTGKFDVAEMCIIDENGIEHSRITGSEIAPNDDLSTEEASAPFFNQAFELNPKQSASTSIYMSPDALTWVVAYVSPLLIDGKKSAFAHYEHGLAKFRDLANKSLPSDVYLLMVSPDGYVFSDSRKDIPLAAQGEKEAESDYFASLDKGLKGVESVLSDMKAGKSSGVVNARDDQGNTVEVAYENVDSWYVVAVSK